MKNLIEVLVEETGIHPEILQIVVRRTMEHLHRGYYEEDGYEGYTLRGLAVDLDPQAYSHFIGMQICISALHGGTKDDRWGWMECCRRVVRNEDFEQMRAEMETWMMSRELKACFSDPD